MKIEILGMGCSKCNKLAEVMNSAASKLGIEYELVKITDFEKIADYGVMMTPALAINGQVVIAGYVPSMSEATTILTTALAKS